MAEGLLAGSPHTVSTASQPAIAPHVTYSTPELYNYNKH